MNNTTKATGSFSIHCAQSSDDELDFLYYSNRCNIKGRSSKSHDNNPLSVQFKNKSVSPFEPLAKDRNYDAINGGGKISPLPQNEYEIWAKRKREIQNFHHHHSFHHRHFRPLVISQNDKVGIDANADMMTGIRSSSSSSSVAYHGEGCNSEQLYMMESVEELKLENEYLHKKVERLERLLQQQHQHQLQHHSQVPSSIPLSHGMGVNPQSKDQHDDEQPQRETLDDTVVIVDGEIKRP
jgi:hypothetical protein